MDKLQRTLIASLALIALGGIPAARAADDAASAPAAAASAAAPASAPAPAAAGSAETGLAAVYSDRLNGHKTANGERYNRNQLTAAHKTLPFGTRVKVTNTKNHRSVTVRINDRGPTQAGRILDISPAAAKAIGIRPKAMAEVSAVVVGQAPKRAAHHKPHANG